MVKTTNILLVFFVCCFAIVGAVRAQDNSGEKSKDEKFKNADKSKSDGKAATSIGGKEHEAEILGVKIGMDVPTTLEAVFVNANRKPGQEKPDAQRKEGKDGKDIRVLYKNLPQGEMEIVFANGKAVKEVILKYALEQRTENLRLPSNGGSGVALSGERFDDRYTIGFTDNKKQERLWWRDEKTEKGFRQRIAFTSGNLSKGGSVGQDAIVYKTISVTPGDENKFADALLK
ncbi:MAG: hypothetical protein M3Q99_04585 [Acidobacteriota bacterium]|nr:hypothetical protein [Acidobacteriota bacterium]